MPFKDVTLAATWRMDCRQGRQQEDQLGGHGVWASEMGKTSEQVLEAQ